MKRIITVLLVVLPNLVFAGGLTNIQAVCKINLNNGTNYEGFITLAYGGFENFYKPNGFCVIKGDSIKTTYFFSLGKVNGIGFENFRKNFPNAKICFIENQPNENIETYQTYQYLSSKNRLQVEYKNDFIFKLSDSLEIYNELPSLDLNKRGKSIIKISFNDIESFELLDNPSEKSLQEINLKRKSFNSSKSEMGDYVEPLWYHEILKDREKFLYLLKYFLYE